MGSRRLHRGVAFAALLHLFVALAFMIQLPWKRNVPQARMEIPFHLVSLSAPPKARLTAPPPSRGPDRSESRQEPIPRRTKPAPEEQQARPVPVKAKEEPEKKPKANEPAPDDRAGEAADSTLTGAVHFAGDAEGSLEIGVEGSISQYSYYLAVVRDKIARYWEPPAGIISGDKEVTSKVNFRIDRRGKILASYLEEPSGTSVFDQAGLRAVAMADPLPPLPQDYDGEWLGIHLRFVYKD